MVAPPDQRRNRPPAAPRPAASRSSLRTWYVVSNLSYMNRVIMLVLPTLWSPRKTSLYLASGVTALVAMVAGAAAHR